MTVDMRANITGNNHTHTKNGYRVFVAKGRRGPMLARRGRHQRATMPPPPPTGWTAGGRGTVDRRANITGNNHTTHTKNGYRYIVVVSSGGGYHHCCLHREKLRGDGVLLRFGGQQLAVRSFRLWCVCVVEVRSWKLEVRVRSSKLEFEVRVRVRSSKLELEVRS